MNKFDESIGLQLVELWKQCYKVSKNDPLTSALGGQINLRFPSLRPLYTQFVSEQRTEGNMNAIPNAQQSTAVAVDMGFSNSNFRRGGLQGQQPPSNARPVTVPGAQTTPTGQPLQEVDMGFKRKPLTQHIQAEGAAKSVAAVNEVIEAATKAGNEDAAQLDQPLASDEIGRVLEVGAKAAAKEFSPQRLEATCKAIGIEPAGLNPRQMAAAIIQKVQSL